MQKIVNSLPVEADRLVSVAEVRHRLGVCQATAYKLFNSGALPSLMVGRNRKVRLSTLLAYMAQGSETGTPSNH